jgi:hypothetical protein
MEEKTKKKRVQKRAVRKKVKSSEPVSAGSVAAVTPKASTTEAKKPETKKPRKRIKLKSAANTRKIATLSPTFEQVQLRAYFISERRRKLGLPGDESHDWLTAEQELRQELSV